jgi:hypothetical protein
MKRNRVARTAGSELPSRPGCAQLSKAVRPWPRPALRQGSERRFDFSDGIDYEVLAGSHEWDPVFGGIDPGFQFERGVG